MEHSYNIPPTFIMNESYNHAGGLYEFLKEHEHITNRVPIWRAKISFFNKLTDTELEKLLDVNCSVSVKQFDNFRQGELLSSMIVDIKVLPAVGDFVRWFAVVHDCLGHLSVITG